METNQPQRLFKARRVGPLINGARHRDQRLDVMKFCFVAFGLENLPGYLEHDSPRITFSVLVMLPGWKINSQTGAFVAHLTGLSVKVVADDIIEHYLVHQDVEDRVITSLVDQRPGLERLIKALVNHPDDHQVRLARVLGLTRG